MLRTSALLCVVGFMSLAACGAPEASSVASSPVVQVYKTPTCGCCEKWADHLETAGFQVERTEVADLREIKQRNGVPGKLASCHTALVDGYLVEGHVPAADVQRMLRERPDIVGLFVPGMPQGSPGMESPNPEPYSVLALDRDGGLSVYSRHE